MVNQRAKTIDIKTAESLYGEIKAMELVLSNLKRKVAEFLPAQYGSDLWWEKSTMKALKEIQEGKGVEFEDIEKAIRWLNS